MYQELVQKAWQEVSKYPLNVILEDNQQFVAYDVMPYFINEYKEAKKKKGTPTKDSTKEEWSKWVQGKATYMYWSRCQYEIILKDWPCMKVDKKIDVYDQLVMNWDLVLERFFKNIFKEVPKHLL